MFGKWNNKTFCKKYFEILADSQSHASISPFVLCKTNDRCNDTKLMEYYIDELRVNMADCRIHAQHDKKMASRYQYAIASLRCALECTKKEPEMSAEAYIKLPQTTDRSALLIQSVPISR